MERTYENSQKDWNKITKICNTCKDIIDIIHKNNFIEGYPLMEFSIYNRHYYITIALDKEHEQTYIIEKDDALVYKSLDEIKECLFGVYIRKGKEYYSN